MADYDASLWTNYGGAYLRLTFDVISTNSANNTSTVRASLKLGHTGSGSPYNGNTSSASMTIDGTTYNWSGGYGLSGNQEVTLISNQERTITHTENGTKTITISSSFDGASAGTYSGTYRNGFPIGDGGSSWNITLTNFDRSANTPYYNNITRNLATNVYVTYARTGSVNGPTTYVLERATNDAMTANYTTFGEGNQTVNANTAYYYRMYAYGDEGGNKYSGVYGPYWGQPVPPTNVVGTRSTSVGGRIDVSWTKPSNTQGGIQYYHVYRNGTYIAQVNGENSVSYSDTGLTRGTNHTYQVYALGASFWSEVSNTSTSTMAPGVPSAPAIPTISNKVGRTLTLNSTRGSLDYGNTISEYRIQLSTDGGATWKGWNNTTKSFTANNTFNVLDSSGNFTYQLLSPALTYKWRVYAVNSIGTGDIATTSTGVFVSSGGKRWTGTDWAPTETAKRWDGTQWLDLTIAKRWDGSSWVDLT